MVTTVFRKEVILVVNLRILAVSGTTIVSIGYAVRSSTIQVIVVNGSALSR